MPLNALPLREPLQQQWKHLPVVSDQGWDIVWQWHPEELKKDGNLLWVIGGVALFMSPGSGRVSLATEMVEVAMVDLITTEIRHVLLILTEESLYNKI